MSEIQSVLFDRQVYSEAFARKWLAAHGLKAHGKVHETPRYWRFRQYDPVPGARYRTKEVDSPGVKFVLEFPRLGIRPDVSRGHNRS